MQVRQESSSCGATHSASLVLCISIRVCHGKMKDVTQSLPPRVLDLGTPTRQRVDAMLRSGEPSEAIQRMIRVRGPACIRISARQRIACTYFGGLSRRPAAGCCAAHKMYLCSAALFHSDSSFISVPVHDAAKNAPSASFHSSCAVG